MLHTLKCIFFDMIVKITIRSKILIIIRLKSNGDFYCQVKKYSLENISGESVFSISDHIHKSTRHELERDP